ncbi:MAG: TerD family protein [Planctomycetia bacterium]|nr:TerD family protein [Planctomycetia bacterium]
MIGSNSNNTKQNHSLFHVALGWDANEANGSAVDLDLSCFLLNEEKTVRSNEDFIYYNQLDFPNGCIKHLGDCLGDSSSSTTGELASQQDGTEIIDAESMDIDLSLIPRDVVEVVIAVTIYEAQKRKHNFGDVPSAYVRILNGNGKEICRYKLSNAPGENTGLIFGSLQRQGNSWIFQTIKKFFTSGLRELALMYGVELE